MSEINDKVAAWLDANVWDGDKVSMDASLINNRAHKAHFGPHDLYELVTDLIESIKGEEEMRIRVKYKDIEIEVSEEGALKDSRQVTMRFDNENKHIQETIKVMTDQVIKLIEIPLVEI